MDLEDFVASNPLLPVEQHQIKVQANKLPYKNVIFDWKIGRKKLTFLKNSTYSLENDIMLIITFKNDLFSTPLRFSEPILSATRPYINGS